MASDGGSSGSRRELLFLLGHPEVPLELEQLALGIAHHPLTVAPELRVVRRKQRQPSERPVPEGIDDLGLPPGRLDFPVGGDGPQVHDPDVPSRGKLLLGFFQLVGHVGMITARR